MADPNFQAWLRRGRDLGGDGEGGVGDGDGRSFTQRRKGGRKDAKKTLEQWPIGWVEQLARPTLSVRGINKTLWLDGWSSCDAKDVCALQPCFTFFSLRQALRPGLRYEEFYLII